MSKIRSAVFISFLSRYGSTALNIISVVVLSRLLTPDDIGIYSVGAAVISLAHMLRDFGVPNYVLQEKDLTLNKLRTASGLAIIIGWSLAFVLFSLSDNLAAYYEEPGIHDVLMVLAFNFILIPIGVISPALLRREMRFKPILYINVSGTFVNVTTTIILALNDVGYMSMAWGSLCGIIMTVMVSLYFLPKEYRALPGLCEWRSVLNFGSYNTVSLLMTEGGNSGSELVIGKLTDFATLGLFSRACGYTDIFRRLVIGAVLPVIHAVLSQESRAGNSMVEPYLKSFTMMLAVGIPGYFFLSAMSAPLILFLYGDQWVDATTAASLVCISAIPTLITIINRQALLSIGQVKTLAHISLIVQPLKLLMVILVAKNGLEIIALTLIAAELMHLLVSQRHVNRIISLNIKLWFKEVFICFVIGILTLVAPLIVLTFYSDMMPLFQIFLGISGAAIGWLLGLRLLRHPLDSEVKIVCSKLVNRIKKK